MFILDEKYAVPKAAMDRAISGRLDARLRQNRDDLLRMLGNFSGRQ